MIRILVVILLAVSNLFARDEHIGAASTVSTVAPGGVWTNPSNAAGLDDTWASISFSSPSDVGRPIAFGGFAWAVPDISCLVKGVTVRVYARGTGGAAFGSVRMASGTTPYGDTLGANHAISAEGWIDFGGPEETWGFGEMTWEEWSAGFTGCRISVKSLSGSATVEIDHVEIIIHTLGDKFPATAVGDSGFYLNKHPSSAPGGTARLHINLNRFKAVATQYQRVQEVVVGTQEGLPLVSFVPSGDPLVDAAASELAPHFHGFQQRGNETNVAVLASNERFEGISASGTLFNTFHMGYDGLKTIWFVGSAWGGSPAVTRSIPGFIGSALPSSDPAPGVGTVAPWAYLGSAIEDVAPSGGLASYVLADKNRRYIKRSPYKYQLINAHTEPDYFRWIKYELVEAGDGGGGTSGTFPDPGPTVFPTLPLYTLKSQEEFNTKADSMYPWNIVPADLGHTTYVPPGGHDGGPGGGINAPNPNMPSPPANRVWEWTINFSDLHLPGQAGYPDETFVINFQPILPLLPWVHALLIAGVVINGMGVIWEELRRY